MTIVYCDFINGDDTNGTGSASSPYKTITKASTGLTGGDEVRVAKSPDPTALTGTLTFTLNSTAVTGSGTAFTTELAIGDFILGADGNWWEAITISSDTSLTLYNKYSGATASGVSSQKLGVTSTGEATSQYATVQSISSSGSSDSSRLKISGGWDLATQEQTGQTFFRQMRSTFGNRWGYGLYPSGKSFTEISKLHFLRYYMGIILVANSNNNNIFMPICLSNQYYNIAIESSLNNYIYSPICLNAGEACISIQNNAHNNTIISPICANGNSGVAMTNVSNNNLIFSPTCYGSNYGIRFINSYNNTILGTLSLENNANGNIYCDKGINYINKAIIGSGAIASGFANYVNSRIFINDIGGESQIWTDNANAVRQDATAGGTGKEWKLSITSANRAANYPFSVAIAQVPLNANKQVTVRLYFKKSGTGIAGRLLVRGGQIAGVDNDVYTNCPDNTNRNQVMLQFVPTEKGVVEIEVQAWYAGSTVDYIIIDNIDITQED